MDSPPSKDLESINEYELSENIDNYYISNSNIECIGLQAFAPNWYRDIKSKKDIERIVQRLEDIQIIGEIPMKYWEKNAIECKINIINPEYFSKFDLKAGFWQVKMAEESIEWTAFTCPQGHYEWLVMPLGLKNAADLCGLLVAPKL